MLRTHEDVLESSESCFPRNEEGFRFDTTERLMKKSRLLPRVMGSKMDVGVRRSSRKHGIKEVYGTTKPYTRVKKRHE